MRRRDLLKGLAALPASTVMPVNLYAQAVQTPNRLIDVHCHIFNADDLPMVDFIEKVIIRTLLSKKKTQPYVPVVDAILRDMAARLTFAADDEFKYLDDVNAGRRQPRSRTDIEDAERGFLTKLFTQWAKEKRKPPNGVPFLAKILSDYVPIIAIGLLRREMYPGQYNVPIDFKLGSILNNRDHAFDLNAVEIGTVNNPAFDPKSFANAVYDSPQGTLSRSILWGLSFTRYRHELARDLKQVNRGLAVLMTPALVDFNKWLDTGDSVPIAQQVALMERLSRERPIDTPRIHGFVPFDPLRQVLHDKLSGKPEESPLAIVDKAIKKQGFIGVKLYPPMGFRVSENAAAGNDFPCWVRYGSGSPGYYDCDGRRVNARDALGDEPGALLDEAMIKLFAWCRENDAPIMAHTNNSQAAGPGYGTRADPKYWVPIFNRFPEIRVDMAHFGGFDEARDDDKFNMAALDKTWEWVIGKMIAAHPDRPLFADFSYFSEVLDKGSNLRKQTVAAMDLFRRTFPNTDKILLYGTDWSMIGHEEKYMLATKRLPDIAAEFLWDAGYKEPGQLDSIFYKNSIRFLGLRSEDREKGTRGRLEAFHGPANSGWLSAFD